MKSWVKVSIAVVAFVGVIWLSLASKKDTSHEEKETDRIAKESVQPQIAAPESRASAAKRPPQVSAGPDGLTPLGMSGQEFSRRGGDRRTLAFSADEAVWLDKHGFPKPGELLELRTTAKSELQQRANSGDPVGMALLAKRM